MTAEFKRGEDSVPQLISIENTTDTKRSNLIQLLKLSTKFSLDLRNGPICSLLMISSASIGITYRLLRVLRVPILNSNGKRVSNLSSPSN